MSDIKNIEGIISEELPILFKEELEVNLLKVNVTSCYSDDDKTVVIKGKLFNEDREKYPKWKTIEPPHGKVECKSRSKAAFAIGVLKGKRVYVETIEFRLNLDHYPNIRRTLNLHKIKGGVEKCFKDKVNKVI